MRAAEAIRRAHQLYDGDSPPLSIKRRGDKALDISWWLTSPQREAVHTKRYKAAMALYIHLGCQSAVPLSDTTFPALFDFDDVSMRPDKAAIKVFYEQKLIEARMMKAQLVFDLNTSGQGYLDEFLRG